jgi:hypothetical protein
MFAAQTGTGVLMAARFHNGNMAAPAADGMIALICLFVASFSYSWGPLGWLVRVLPPCSVSWPLHTMHVLSN